MFEGVASPDAFEFDESAVYLRDRHGRIEESRETRRISPVRLAGHPGFDLPQGPIPFAYAISLAIFNRLRYEMQITQLAQPSVHLDESRPTIERVGPPANDERADFGVISPKLRTALTARVAERSQLSAGLEPIGEPRDKSVKFPRHFFDHGGRRPDWS